MRPSLKTPHRCEFVRACGLHVTRRTAVSPPCAAAIADAVRVTLGPRSRCVLIEKKWGKPLVCNDGVTIAKEFTLKDPDENLGAQMRRG